MNDRKTSGAYLIWARVSALGRRFQDDTSGTVAIIFCLALLPLFLLVGSAIDYSRASNDRAAFQRAVDGAVIAAARQQLADNERIPTAEKVFKAVITPAQLTQVTSMAFSMDTGSNKVIGRVAANTPTAIMKIGGWDNVPIGTHAEAIIAKPRIRQLDLVMCIDASKSMDATLNAVRTNALDFEANLNAELLRRGIDPFDAMRLRVIFFRDYGGTYREMGPDYYNPNSGVGTYVWQQSGWVWADPADPNRFRYVGDVPALRASQFWSLPAERTLFSSFVQTETAWGGGDPPESGLECVNEAMDSPWARVGDLTPSGKKLSQVYPVIAVWTMSETHPPDWAQNLLNPSYPSSSKMPRSHSGLLMKWNDATKIDSANRMLVFFGNPNTPEDGKGGNPNGWQPLTKWPGFMQGGTLTNGTNQMVLKITDAIIAKLSKPILSQ